MPPQTANPRPCGFPRDVQRANVAVCPLKLPPAGAFRFIPGMVSTSPVGRRGNTEMKKILLAVLAATLLSGCALMDEEFWDPYDSEYDRPSGSDDDCDC
jgi:hypothetical protein